MKIEKVYIGAWFQRTTLQLSEVFDFLRFATSELKLEPKKLKELRLMLGCTQAQMANLLGITVRGYRNYELGAREPELSVLIKLADYFNVSLDELVGRVFPK